MTHEKQDNVRKTVIGGPLLITLVFCFGFFLVNQSAGGVARSNSVTTAARKKKPTSSATVEQLPSLSPAANLQPLGQAQPNGAGTTYATPLQSSGSDAANLQSSASQHANSISSGNHSVPGSGVAPQGQSGGNGPLHTTVNDVLKLL